jgi:hypothetical protein
MNDIEERLRAGLHQLAEPVDAHVDTDSALSGGDRLRRGRMARWASGGVVLATLVGVLAWNGVSWRQVVAIPDPATTATTARRAPSAILSFPVSDPPQTWTGARVSVVRTGDRLTVELARVQANGDEGASHTYTTAAGEFWSVPVEDDLVVAVIPNPVVSVASLAGWDVSVNDGLDALGITVVGVQRSNPAVGAYGGLVWRGANFGVHNSEGAVVPSAVLEAGDRSVIVFRDEGLGVWGYLDAYNDVHAALPMATEPMGTVYDLARNPDGEVTEIGFLPAGGRDPKLTVWKGATWGSAAVGDSGRVAYIVFAVNPGSTPLVTSVTYTDASGNRATYRP